MRSAFARPSRCIATPIIPLWDIEFIGAQQHAVMLGSLLGEHKAWIHALEINRFRPWRENKEVMAMAKDFGLSVVSGGDRHCCRSNTVLNLTRAASFAEFAAEVREDGRSDILLMPEYRESRVLRTLEVVADVLRHYPNHPQGQFLWTNRVFIDLEDKGLALTAWAGVRIEIEIGYTLFAMIGGLASGLMGAIYPALRAAGQDAVEALSYE